MGATYQGYGSTYSPNTTFTASGTILDAMTYSRYEVDHLRINVVSLDSGSTVKIGFGASSDSPQIFYTETSNSTPYDQRFDQPGIGNPDTANQALTITITGNATVNVRVGYHRVPVTMPPASQRQSPGGY